MNQTDLWKYCTSEHCRDMLLSFELLGSTGWPDEKVMACLYAFSNHTERHYHAVHIPRGNGTMRRLFVPDKMLMRIQRNILHHILDGYPVSGCATAYRKGTGVADNARVHKGTYVVVKLDIKDFFGSISFPMVYKNAFSGHHFPPAVRTMLTSLCCYKEFLPQGAPTSPAISNLVMKPFDEYMEEWCKDKEISYTRYCDDMTFSGDFNPGQVIRKVSGFLTAMGFELNEAKTRILYRNTRQAVTGIVVNEKVQVSRDYRRKLRQEAFYCLKYGVKSHMEKKRINEGITENQYLLSLLGKIQYILLVNPEDQWFQEAREKLGQLFTSDHSEFI
ncbi:reverse transcriptase family protein [Lacrimispora sp.]|uniref:reverse transcriptase family protein n=1 Tax=Lacrimispora sp. TaxID=2719234 RepID=UPI00345F5A83